MVWAMTNPTNVDIGVEPWRRTLLPMDASVQTAIANLDEFGLKIALVVDPEGVLIGTVTDGDIRRGLLRGLDICGPIAGVIHRDPLVAPPQMARRMVLQLMQANKIQQLPIVDEQRRVIGIYLQDEMQTPQARDNVMVIMAGGRGTRMLPHTRDCPKPMLPVGGKPMLEHIIERASAEGITRFVLAIHYLGQMIEDHFGDGSRWGIDIAYLREKSPLGTGGALGLLTPVPSTSFLITNGDVLTDIRYCDLLDFHIRHGAVATMAVRLHEWQHPFGVVRTKGIDIVGFDEKPVSRSHINAGIYVLEPTALDNLEVNAHCDMPTLFARLQAASARTIVYPMHEPWLDVGRPDDLAQARNGHALSTPDNKMIGLQ